MVFGKSFVGKPDEGKSKRRRQRAISENLDEEADVAGEDKTRRRTRRVTFADIEELHARFGTPPASANENIKG